MLIEVKDLMKTYTIGDVTVNALAGVSLNIDNGEFVAIMGASGSGKSTLLNILGCLDVPTSGSYKLDGIQVSGMTKSELAHVRNQKLGFVFQNFNLLARTSALENVELPTFYHPKYQKQKRAARAMELLERVGLGERVHQWAVGSLTRMVRTRWTSNFAAGKFGPPLTVRRLMNATVPISCPARSVSG